MKCRLFVSALIASLIFFNEKVSACSVDTLPVSSYASRPKVALVLCGGGAKGAAHIGAIRRLEELHITPDFVVGTSMGALIGGLYSMGYTSKQLDSLISGADWTYLLSDNSKRIDAAFARKQADEKYLINIPFYNIKRGGGGKSDDSFVSNLPGGFIGGQNVLNLLNGLAIGYQDSIDFNTLPIHFACVATDLATGEAVEIHNGYLPLAMRASMAIPGVFAPVKMNGKLLVDGGVVNNFPVDVAREMGADVVIGVDVQSDLAGEADLKSLPQVLNQLVGLMGNENYLKNRENTDVYIKPDVSHFGTYSFDKNSIDTLIINGYTAAKVKDEELVALAKKLSSTSADSSSYSAALSPRARDIYKSKFRIGKIEMSGVSGNDKRWLLNLAGISENSTVTGEEINSAVSVFVGTQAFSQVTYKLVQEAGEDEETLHFFFKRGPTNILSFGARYDSEEAAALLLHLGVHQYDLHGSRLGVTARLSYNPYGSIEYSYLFRHFPRLNVAYMFKSTDANIYSSRHNKSNLTYIYNSLDFSLANIYYRNFDIKIGTKIENFKFTKFLSDYIDESSYSLKAHSYLSVYGSAMIDTRDSKHFPVRGLYLNAVASYYYYGFHSGFSSFASVAGIFNAAVKLPHDFVFLPSIAGRVCFENENEFPFFNFIGGSVASRYIDHQLPFIGINYINAVSKSVIIGRIDLRKRIGKKHYVSGIVNYMRTQGNLGSVFDFKNGGYWGCGLKYEYDTVLGPLGFNIHWSNLNDKVGAYVSLGYYF